MTGCGESEDLPETAPVKGTVTYRGKPLIGGTVTFHPQGEEGNPGVGDIQPDGTYRISTYHRFDGAVLGQHAVTVEVFPGQAGGASDGLPGMESKAPSPIPRRYANATTTALKFEVKPGENDLDLKLTD